MLIVFLAYLALLVALLVIERYRTRAAGPDLFTCFLGLFTIQSVIPAAVITGILALHSHDLPINRSFFEQVFVHLDAGTAMHVLLLTVVFIAFLLLTHVAICGPASNASDSKPPTGWYVAMLPWFVIACVGLMCSGLLLWLLGGGIAAYAKLIQFRAGDPSIERTFLTANLYSLTQTFSLLAIVGIVVYVRRRRALAIVFAVLCAVAFSLMTASRRALFLQLILVYFVFVLEHRRLFVREWLVPAALVGLPSIMYGKQILAAIAFDSEIDFSDLGLGSLARAVMDIGITTVESWGTLMYLHEPLRFGVDHVLSVARRIPDGLLALELQFPERIVRISTDTFVGMHHQDVPPGFFGQMWLDWGWFGPALWGIAFGLQTGMLQKAYDSIAGSVGMKAVFALVLFVVALPINSGSFDFTFSVDIIVMFAFLALMVRRRSLNPERVPALGHG